MCMRPISYLGYRRAGGSAEMSWPSIPHFLGKDTATQRGEGLLHILLISSDAVIKGLSILT